MTIHQTTFDRRAFLKAGGVLAIGFSVSATAGANTLQAAKSVAKEAVDSWLTITPDNKVTIFVGKVDLGTGSRTALMQLAADELDVPFERIELVMELVTHQIVAFVIRCSRGKTFSTFPLDSLHFVQRRRIHDSIPTGESARP